MDKNYNELAVNAETTEAGIKIVLNTDYPTRDKMVPSFAFRNRDLKTKWVPSG